MENMEEITEQQNPQPQVVVVEQPQQQQQIEISTEVTESSTAQLTVSVNGPESNIISTQELSPSIASTAVTVVSASGDNNTSMIDSGDFRAGPPMGDPGYPALSNGRMSPSVYNTNVSSYTTLTPLQPLPPISSVTGEKFNSGHASPPNVSGNFTFMQANSGGTVGTIGNMDMNSYSVQNSYNKLGTVSPVNMGSPVGNGVPSMQMMGVSNGYAATMPAQQNTTLATMAMTYPTGTYQNGLHSPKQEPKMVAPSQTYDPYISRQPMVQAGQTVHTSRLHSPNPMMGAATMNGLHPTHTSSPVHSHHLYNGGRDIKPNLDTQGSKGQELEEINTKELAQRISSELKRYSIPQAVFAQRVLCRSQGTLSDLLRNPKPWSKLKSGRETFRRMWKWLQEPEFQRMSALRLAGLCRFHFFFTIIHISLKIIYFVYT